MLVTGSWWLYLHKVFTFSVTMFICSVFKCFKHFSIYSTIYIILSVLIFQCASESKKWWHDLWHIKMLYYHERCFSLNKLNKPINYVGTLPDKCLCLCCKWLRVHNTDRDRSVQQDPLDPDWCPPPSSDDCGSTQVLGPARMWFIGVCLVAAFASLWWSCVVFHKYLI